MNTTQKFIGSLATGLLCGFILHSAWPKADTAPAPAQPVAILAENDLKPNAPPVTAVVSATAAPTEMVKNETQNPAPVAEDDGKTVLEPDGKEVLPVGGKETLPPVGEGVGSQPQMVDPTNVAAPTEYQAVSNPLLAPPSPLNVTGAPVSPETR
ncbi:MAG: hypothetical protein ABSE62_01285 [Chthoniobacteraceae bacterium]|jgi:hypothetical protein